MENGVSMPARSFLIESSSKLLVTRTGIKTWSSSILGRIRPLILELLALEWWKFHTFELEYLRSQLANLDQILCVASLRWWERLRKVLGQIGSKLWFPRNALSPFTQTKCDTRCDNAIIVVVCSSLTSLSTIFQSYHDGVWLRQGVHWLLL